MVGCTCEFCCSDCINDSFGLENQCFNGTLKVFFSYMLCKYLLLLFGYLFDGWLNVGFNLIFQPHMKDKTLKKNILAEGQAAVSNR